MHSLAYLPIKIPAFLAVLESFSDAGAGIGTTLPLIGSVSLAVGGCMHPVKAGVRYYASISPTLLIIKNLKKHGLINSSLLVLLLYQWGCRVSKCLFAGRPPVERSSGCTLLELVDEHSRLARTEELRLIIIITYYISIGDYILHMLAHTCANILAIAGWRADGVQLENFNLSPNPSVGYDNLCRNKILDPTTLTLNFRMKIKFFQLGMNRG